jgi:hypothetical protein
MTSQVEELEARAETEAEAARGAMASLHRRHKRQLDAAAAETSRN